MCEFYIQSTEVKWWICMKKWKDQIYTWPVMTDADTPSTDVQRFFLKSCPEYDHIVSQLAKHQRKPQQTKPDKDCLFTTVLQQVYYWVNYVTPDMLHKQMALYMIKWPHIFYPHISKQLMKDKELYESFVTNIFNGRRWDVWISLAVICHVEYTHWVSYPISPISNKYVSHQGAMCSDHNSKWMASRWNGH